MSHLHTFCIHTSIHTLFDSIWCHLPELILFMLCLDVHICPMGLQWIVFFLCTFTRLEYANQLLLPLPCALSTSNALFHHQRKHIAIPDKDATCNHQDNGRDLIIGRGKSTFDLCRWMIVQYAKEKQCGTLILFIVYASDEKFTETALDHLMNLHWQKTIHTGTAGYAMKI